MAKALRSGQRLGPNIVKKIGVSQPGLHSAIGSSIVLQQNN